MEVLVEAAVGAEDESRQSRKEDFTAKICGNREARRLSRMLARVENMTIERALKHCELRNLSERTVDELDNELGRPHALIQKYIPSLNSVPVIPEPTIYPTFLLPPRVVVRCKLRS